MTFPEDLPLVLVYLLGTYPDRTGQNGGEPCDVTKSTYPRRPVASISTSGNTDAAMICPTIPYGCLGWRLLGETGWRPLDSLPRAWLPFLSRERGTVMDFRPPPCPECGSDAPKAGQKCLRCARKEANRACEEAAES